MKLKFEILRAFLKKILWNKLLPQFYFYFYNYKLSHMKWMNVYRNKIKPMMYWEHQKKEKDLGSITSRYLLKKQPVCRKKKLKVEFITHLFKKKQTSFN